MRVLTIVLAPRGPLDGIRDALVDWSAAGLVAPFLWTSPDLVDDARVPAISIEGGERLGTSIRQIAGQARLDLIRVVELVPVVSGVDPAPAGSGQRLAEFASAAFGLPVTRVRAVVTRAGDPAKAGADLAVAGWHNIVLSPEDATGPGMGTIALPVTRDALELAPQAAAALAGLVGLWAGAPESVLDELPILPGGFVRIARGYFRRLDTDAVERDLRASTLSLEHGFPLPTQLGASTTYVSDVPLAAQTMSEQLFAKHSGALRGPREAPPVDESERVGGGRALAMFFSFLWAALRNAPKQWARAIANGISSDAAGAVQNLVFGNRAAYEVVVNGRTSDGEAADWRDYVGSVRQLDAVLEQSGVANGVREHVAQTDLAPLWRDYTSAGLTLADGGERAAGLPPVQIGPQRGVLRHAADIVPGSDDTFRRIPPHLAPSVGTAGVEPYDELGILALRQRLEVATTQSAVGVQAAQTLAELDAWRSRYEHSYASRVGSRISSAMGQTIAEIREHLGVIGQASNPDEGIEELEGTQRALGLATLISACVAAVLVAVVVVLGANGILEPWPAVAWGAGVVVVWFVVALILFTIGQRELFQFLNRKRSVLARQEVARRNLVHAVRDARRLGEAYTQFLAWSRALGAVLRAPFGPRVEAAGRASTALDGLPLAARIGSAVADERTIADVAHSIRRDLFATGWLTGAWDAALGSAPARLGPRGVELESPETLFRLPAGTPESLLVLWSDSLASVGTDPATADHAWAYALSRLAPAGAAQLTAHAVDARTGARAPVPVDDFMAGVEQDRTAFADRLADGILSDGARVQGLADVVVSRVSRTPAGLGRTVALTQLSDGVEDYRLRMREGVPAGAASSADARTRLNAHATPDLPDFLGGAPV